ncbi:hypothetical protein PHLGIDRAFT_37867 [Phlebiopsis gigantea 11061_1 CR5-6]|uniref:Uncharacterized protein n=1 Tax=Phlebiopsis gigantea (strain 11061_1 CR5-6) TaxID=745531 RepID=A0A0C3S0J4_PHLG1|nr:hypothetical protein PHLGIDRAFT_37867 [Phlebiopsis gigantea 11061_1 CR5-6]
MNFTLDDTASQLSFSSGWASQSPADPDLSQFFERTYHAVQSPGATLNMSIQGTGIYIYGSKGPNHADFNLQVDDEVFKLSASSPTLQFQQPLFGGLLNPSINVHFVSLTALPNGTSDWLDIDFVTVASENQTSTSVTGLPNTVPVPWPSRSLTAVGTTSTSTSSEAVGAAAEQGNDHGSKLNTATEVLAIVFGLVIALVILILLVYGFLRRRYNRQRAKEHSFRLGKAERAALDKPVIGAPTNFEHKDPRQSWRRHHKYTSSTPPPT